MNCSDIPSDSDPVAAVRDDQGSAQDTVRNLMLAGFEMKKLSIVGRSDQSAARPAGLRILSDAAHPIAGAGDFWALVGGLLAGPTLFQMAGIGLLGVAGPFARPLKNALDRAAPSRTPLALASALVSLGACTPCATRYEADVRAGRLLLVVQGSSDDIRSARALLATAASRRAQPAPQPLAQTV